MRTVSFIKQEMIKGIKKTFKYIVSHHESKEYYKCYSIKRNIHICSRCLGIYLGILLGFFIYYLKEFNESFYLIIIAVFPIFTLIDWSVTAFNIHKSYNILRTFYGALLGIAYSLGLILLFSKFPNLNVIIIGAFYVSITGILIYMKYYNKKL